MDSKIHGQKMLHINHPHLPVCESLQKAQRLRLREVKVEVACAVVCRIEQRLEHLLLQRYYRVVHRNPHLLKYTHA